MRHILSLALILFPALTWADYNPEAIKRAVTTLDAFQIEGWRPSDNGEASIATTGLAGVVLSVGPKSSGIMTSAKDSTQGLIALLRCQVFAEIGLSPETEAQRGQIQGFVQTAIQDEGTKSLELNGVKFEVSPIVAGDGVLLSCLLSPAG